MNYGEIIELGRHRLMCGDATSREDVMKLIGNGTVNLVLTDPPYGIKRVNHKTGHIGSGKYRYRECIGDWNSGMFYDSYRILRVISNSFIIWGGQHFTDILPPTMGWIFWDKMQYSETLSFGDGELAWSNVNTKIKKYAFRWSGFHRDGDKNLNERIHPTQKPVELHMRILEDFSQSDDVILDCFGGSGTTLIACEMTGRKCLMMEISPEYCDVIQERYMKLKEEYPLNL